MAGEPVMTLVGNAANDAELKYTPSGAALATFTLAVTPRIKQGDSWKDGETTWFRCSVWREMAEQVAETVTKGMRLIVHGRFKTRQYEKDGQTRTSIEIDVEEVGPSLRYATAQVKKMQRSSSDQQGGGGFGSTGSGSSRSRTERSVTPNDDPWASSVQASGQGAFPEEPPF
jgi:single-strand DNA-binding protein